MPTEVIINISDSIPPQNIATIDKDGAVGNTYTKTQFDDSFSTKSEEIDTKIENIQQMVESDFKGTLKPTDTAPTEDGSYKPEISSEDDKPTDPNSSADWGKIYPNAGNLRSKSGYDTMFYKKGTVWKRAETKMPEAYNKIDTWVAGNYSVGRQVINPTDQSIYEANADVTSYDVPGVSSKWTKKINALTVASGFNPTNSVDAQGAKQINDYYIGKQDEYVNKLQGQIINGTWSIVSLAGYNTTVIDVVAGDKVSITGLDSSNTDFSAGLKPIGQNSKTLLSKFSNNFSFVVPVGYEKFCFLSNGAQNWKVLKNYNGALSKVPEYLINEKSVSWSDGTWNDNGQATALSGYRKSTINRVPSKIKLSGFSNTEKYLKLYSSSNLKMFEIQPFSNEVEYDLTGFYNYAVVLQGSETGGKIYEYEEIKTSSYQRYLNVKDEGAKGDGVTDDTAAINAAILKLISRGGGTLFFPSGIYNVTQVVIPNMGTDWISISLEGELPPSYKIGSVNPVDMTYNAYDITKGKGSIIRSTATTVNSVLYALTGSGYMSFNLGLLSLKNLIFRTYDNPRISGVHCQNMAQLSVENCVVDTGTYCVVASQPTYESIGILVPNHSNAGMITLNKVSISGYKYGLSIYEHTSAENIFIAACVHALYFNFSDIPSYFNKITVHICTNVITIANSCVFEISQLSLEYAAPSQMNSNTQWHGTTWELNDPSNKGAGRLIYSNNKGTVGKVNTWRVNGGANVYVYNINNPTTRITTTIPSP